MKAISSPLSRAFEFFHWCWFNFLLKFELIAWKFHNWCRTSGSFDICYVFCLFFTMPYDKLIIFVSWNLLMSIFRQWFLVSKRLWQNIHTFLNRFFIGLANRRCCPSLDDRLLVVGFIVVLIVGCPGLSWLWRAIRLRIKRKILVCEFI